MKLPEHFNYSTTLSMLRIRVLSALIFYDGFKVKVYELTYAKNI